jgi:Holliday junction resolvasome RuvABC endonuclease subunit
MSKFAKPVKVGVILVLAILIACIGFLVIEAQTKIIRRAYDNFILDNENHYLPCEKLPTETEVSKVLQEHQDMIRAIEQVNPGLVGVDIDTMTCPGKADLIIWYATHQDRVEIKRIIGEDTFFGVPYRMQNR